MDKVKVLAMYLPQYHETEENNRFWGKGFSDWVSVRKAVPQFSGHDQPKKPLDGYYYDLSKKEDIVRQAELAKKYGVSGFGIYHYWFSCEKQALTRPAEIILENKDIDVPFFFAWDNASWKRTWSSVKGNDWSPLMDEKKGAAESGPEILIEYIAGTEKDWKKHFDFLLPYFKDERYIKDNGKPLFLIYNYSPDTEKMAAYWDKLAVSEGFAGVEVVYSYNPFHGIPSTAKKFRYEPLYSGWGRFIDRLGRLLLRHKVQTEVKTYSYDDEWERIIANARRCRDKNTYYGAFVSYDDTPRRGSKGKAVLGATPEKFCGYLRRLREICSRQGKNYIFLTAWNEWGEGAYLEPDSVSAYAYLEAYQKSAE